MPPPEAKTEKERTAALRVLELLRDSPALETPPPLQAPEPVDDTADGDPQDSDSASDGAT
ncbi:hypothetical protein [Lentzea terrae]|uniref:hypothetical protein n=1 Tax=Lentzea terrae TaxID=2200761 RepID=UPI000DD31360|nr:hypothetical protein [Lentzea terrae]